MSQSKKLDFSSLEKAIYQLKDALECYEIVKKQQERLVLHLRAATIQAFEFTYELSWKMLKRYLEVTEPNPTEIDQMSFPDLIRTGCERGLVLSDVSVWKVYRQERSATSHAYDQEKAQEVFEKIPAFLKEAEHLLTQLKSRQ